MAAKEFKSIDEQINLLRSRGLSIPDEAEARQFLLRNNYYRISGYSLTLRSNDVFSPNATFQNIVDIYKFDYELRHLLLKYLEIIEVSIKSIYAYVFCKHYGPCGYLDEANFTDAEQYKKTMAKADSQKEVRHQNEAYLKHFLDELQDDIPLWAYVDLMTFSDISFLYKITEKTIQEEITVAFGLDRKLTDLMGHFLHRLTIIRNLCAHGSRLYNRLFEQKPRLSKKEKQHLITNPDGTMDNAHLIGFLFLMKKLLKPDEYAAFKAELVLLTKKYPFVDMKHYGFRNDWEQFL